MSRTLLGETPQSVLEVLVRALDNFEADDDRCDLTREGLQRGVQLARSCGAVLGDALEARFARVGVVVEAPPKAPPETPPPQTTKTVAEVAAALRAENPDFAILDAPSPDRPVAGHTHLRITCTECDLVFCMTLDAWNKKRKHDCLCTTPVPKFTTLYARPTVYEFKNIRTFLYTTRRFALRTTAEEFGACRASLTLVCSACKEAFVCRTSGVVCAQCPRGCAS